MIFAFINNYKVEQLEDLTIEDVDLIRHLYQIVIDTTDLPRAPKIGWVFDNGTLYPDIKPVTPRQIRQAWILLGNSLSIIDIAIDTLPEPHKSLARAEWEYSTLVFRRNKLVTMLGQMNGYTDDQLDTLWIFAGAL